MSTSWDLLKTHETFSKPYNAKSTKSILVACVAAVYLAAAVASCLSRPGGPNSLSYLRYKAA